MNTAPGALVVLLGLVLLGTCADDAPEAHPEAHPEPDFVVLLDDDSDADQIMGQAGAYALTARGAGRPPYAVIEVPAGFSNFGFFAVWPQASEENEPFSTVEYWTVHGVYKDPCRWEGAAPEIGPTVEDLVEAVAQQRHTKVAAGPEAVTLDGYDGVRLRVRVPADLDDSSCTEGRYMFWNGAPGDAHHQAPLGTTEEWWILNIDGQRAVLGTAATEGVPESDVDELTAMVESVRFVER